MRRGEERREERDGWGGGGLKEEEALCAPLYSPSPFSLPPPPPLPPPLHFFSIAFSASSMADGEGRATQVRTVPTCAFSLLNVVFSSFCTVYAHKSNQFRPMHQLRVFKGRAINVRTRVSPCVNVFSRPNFLHPHSTAVWCFSTLVGPIQRQKETTCAARCSFFWCCCHYSC